jgi:cyclophilin family peptidyl-prolyl cis-trans isomerase
MQQKPTHAPIAIESNNGLKNVRGSIAMARTMDPNSATA